MLLFINFLKSDFHKPSLLVKYFPLLPINPLSISLCVDYSLLFEPRGRGEGTDLCLSISILKYE